MFKMGGKFLSGTGALSLAVFTVALTEYWKSDFVQGIIKFIINIPAALQEPVGVPFWLVIVASLLLVAMLLRICWIVVQDKFEREASRVKPASVPDSYELPIYITNDQKRILSFLGYAEDNDSMASLQNLAKSVRLSKLKYDYALQQLQKGSLVLIHKGYGEGPEIMLTEKGKEFIVTNYVSTERNAWYGYT